MEYLGLGLAFIGAALAVGLACSGSAKGVGHVGELAPAYSRKIPENFPRF